LPADLLAVALLALATLVFTLTPMASLAVVRIPLGLVIVLFVPGYSLIAALFPRKNDLDGIERLALSFGLSIAVVPLIGLGLNYTPWGIRLTPVVVSLALFTLAMAAAAHWRRLSLPSEDRLAIHFRKNMSLFKQEILAEDKGRLDKALTVLLIITIIMSIAASGIRHSDPQAGREVHRVLYSGPGRQGL
jgi:uncharacterized membrane protein